MGEKIEGLTDEQERHVYAFIESRPDWITAVNSPLMCDEGPEQGEHTVKRPHPYLMGMDYTLKHLRDCVPCKVLDIGSPFAQVVAAKWLPGVEIATLDIRANPGSSEVGVKWIQGNATSIPAENGAYDVVTSMWVLGHVGDGRYGDALDVNGDVKMIREMARVLRKGGKAIFGPGLMGHQCANLFNMHRMYTWEWLEREFEKANLQMLEKTEFLSEKDLFLDPSWSDISKNTVVILNRRDGFYGACVLKKI